MSLQATKTHFIQLLAEQENKVIALSGKWGTGKSHLWREVRDESQDERVKKSLYVSLFGLGDINEVKLKIVQVAIANSKDFPGLWRKVTSSIAPIRNVLESLHKGFSVLNDVALLAVPTILKDRVIVLDDIERKHEKLSIDEVLGFIDEFTQQHGARFILIMNSDQLVKKEIWETLREKVVDQELRLNTSPSEAFDIAAAMALSLIHI